MRPDLERADAEWQEKMKWERDGRELYWAYERAVGGKNYQGLPMPKWDDLPEKIKQAWIAVAHRAQEIY